MICHKLMTNISSSSRKRRDVHLWQDNCAVTRKWHTAHPLCSPHADVRGCVTTYHVHNNLSLRPFGDLLPQTHFHVQTSIAEIRNSSRTREIRGSHSGVCEHYFLCLVDRKFRRNLLAPSSSCHFNPHNLSSVPYVTGPSLTDTTLYSLSYRRHVPPKRRENMRDTHLYVPTFITIV
jgi:hypothetical protein